MMHLSAEAAAYIAAHPDEWIPVVNRRYEAQIQLANPGQEYNVPGRPGVVYNCLEDSCEEVAEGGYVVTGLMGEMWPIPARSLAKYDIAPEAVTNVPQKAPTIESPAVYTAIRIPPELTFTLEVDYGRVVLLSGNAPGIAPGHGEGDYILTAAAEENGRYIPDPADCGRIVNGALFWKIYKKRD